MTKIRQLQKSDNKLLASIIRSIFEEHNAPRKNTVYSDAETDNLFEVFQSNSNSYFLVATIDEKVVGGCGIYPTDNLPKNCIELVKFYISKNARGKGIGKILMEKCIRQAKITGFTKLYIESFDEFSKAVSIYEKLGFTKLDKPLGNSGHTACNIWMEKNI